MKSRLSAGDAKSAAPRKECFSRRSLRTFAIFAISALAVAFAAVSAQQPAPNAAWTIQLDEIVSPAAANTMEPQLTVEGSRTILSWLERNGPHTTLKFAERTAGGWSGARTAAQGDNFMVNASDVPSVRLLADGTLVAEWLTRRGYSYGYSRYGYSPWYYGPFYPGYTEMNSPDYFVRLTFAPDGMLKASKRFYK